MLVIGVAESSLRADRQHKTELYAYANVPELWLANLAAREVTSYTKPDVGAHGVVRTARPGESLTPSLIPDLTIAVSEIFGFGIGNRPHHPADRPALTTWRQLGAAYGGW